MDLQDENATPACGFVAMEEEVPTNVDENQHVAVSRSASIEPAVKGNATMEDLQDETPACGFVAMEEEVPTNVDENQHVAVSRSASIEPAVKGNATMEDLQDKAPACSFVAMEEGAHPPTHVDENQHVLVSRSAAMEPAVQGNVTMEDLQDKTPDCGFVAMEEGVHPPTNVDENQHVVVSRSAAIESAVKGNATLEDLQDKTPACGFVAMEEGTHQSTHVDEHQNAVTGSTPTASAIEPRIDTSIILASISNDRLTSTEDGSSFEATSTEDARNQTVTDNACINPKVDSVAEVLKATSHRRQIVTNPGIAGTLIATKGQHVSSRPSRAKKIDVAGRLCVCAGKAVISIAKGIANLLWFLVLISPIVLRIVSLYWFWQFAAARGKAKTLECDLDIERFFRYSVFMEVLTTIGFMLQPVKRPLAKNVDQCTLLISIAFVLLFFFFGLDAVVWISDDATCPEIAPDLFHAAKQFLICEAYLFAVSLVVNTLQALVPGLDQSYA